MENISRGTRKAIKIHTCDYCNGEIKIGETYNYQFNKANGEIYTWKSHMKCEDVASYYRMHDECWDEGLDSESFKEHISNAFHKTFSFHERIDLLYDRIKDKIKKLEIE